MGMVEFTQPPVEMDSSSIINARKKKNDDSSIFSLDDFYTLFAKQLENQDMMNPVDDSQFLAQLSQMATVQAMEQMNEMTMTSYAFEFMGKNVIVAEYDSKNDLKTTEGVVERVSLYNGKPQVYVGGKPYELSQVMEVVTPSKFSAADMLGRQVVYANYDDKGEFEKDKDGVIITRVGTVEKVTLYSGKTEIYIGGKAYGEEQILEVLSEGYQVPAPEEPPSDKGETDKTEGTEGTEGTDKTEGTEGKGDGGDKDSGDNQSGDSVTPPDTNNETPSA